MDSISGNSKARKTEEIFSDRINKAIDMQKDRTRSALKEIEKNTRTSYEAHIDYHTFLLAEARKIGDLNMAMHHQIMIETYQSILKNYSLSNSYDNV